MTVLVTNHNLQCSSVHMYNNMYAATHMMYN